MKNLSTQVRVSYMKLFVHTCEIVIHEVPLHTGEIVIHEVPLHIGENVRVK